jgi:hypothetical protein
VFSNKQKIGYVEKWTATTLPAKTFERVHGLPESSIRKWQKHLSELRAADPAGFSKQGSAHRRLEIELMEWLRVRWSWKGFRVSPHMIQARAREIAKRKQLADFVASSGWYNNFKLRSGLHTVRLHGERASADHRAALEYQAKFRPLVADLGLQISNVYNADETLLYPRLQLRTTVCLEKDASELRGKKQDTFRVGMMVTSCADGSHGCPLLFAHSSGKPRTMDAKEYPLVQPNVRKHTSGSHLYYHTHNGWVSRDMISHYLTQVLPAHIRCRNTVDNTGLRALLILDGCGIHFTALFDMYRACRPSAAAAAAATAAVVAAAAAAAASAATSVAAAAAAAGAAAAAAVTAAVAETGPVAINCSDFAPETRSNHVPAPARSLTEEAVMRRIREHGADVTVGDVLIHVRALPPNTTCEVQPCDQGLISWLKAQWRRYLDEVSLSIETEEGATRFAKEIPLVDVMKFLSERIATIDRATGRRYWAPLFPPNQSATIDQDVEESGPSQLEALVALKEGMWEE